MPFINNDFINNLTNKVDIIAVISKRIALINNGRSYKACCPFHQEKTPSFNVSSEKQAYYCFGCGEGGNAISFVQKFDNLNFMETIEILAQEFNMEVIYDTNNTNNETNNNYKNYLALTNKVNVFYQQQLRNKKYNQNVAIYAKNRGINIKIAEKFELGFAPNLWQNLYNNFINNKNDLLALGLIATANKSPSKYYDTLRNRLIFPIHNTKGNVIGFGARAITADNNPKYLNSKESIIFNKSHELYGLYFAKKYTKNLNYLLVVEGYMDVVAMHQNGITSCVATLGTAVSKEHINLLKRTTHNIVFCFDGDKAGIAAAEKALKIVLPLISSQITIKFLLLPNGEDPDSIIAKESKITFEKRIKDATPLSEFLFKIAKKELNIKNIENKTAFIHNAIKLIEQVNYNIYKEQLLQGLAATIGQNIDSIKKIINKTLTPIKHKIPIIKQTSNTDNTIKSYIAKLIAIILNCPAISSDVLLQKIKKIPGTEILAEIIISADFADNPDVNLLITPFKNSKKIYQRLLYLANNNLTLNPIAAQKEVDNILIKINKYNAQLIMQQKIATANNASHDEQKNIEHSIKKNKL